VFYEKFLSVCLQKMHISTINKWTSVVFFRMMTKRFEKELEWGANMNFNKQKMLSVFLSFMVHLGLVSSVTGGSKQAEQKKTQEDMQQLLEEAAHQPILPELSESEQSSKNEEQISNQTKENEQSKEELPKAEPVHTEKMSQAALQAQHEFILTRAYLPLMKLNEGEKLYFYRCTAKKVTVGYGSNIQDNPNLLKGVTVYLNKTPLSDTQRNDFLKNCTSMSDTDLKKYTITRQDAEKMALKSTAQCVLDLKQVPSLKYDLLPLSMQLMCLDIAYNVGKGGFLKYQNFCKWLNAGNFKKALSESTVYTDVKTHKVNQFREDRKQLLFEIHNCIASGNYQSCQAVLDHIKKTTKKANPCVYKLLHNKTENSTAKNIIFFALVDDRNNKKALLSTRVAMTSNVGFEK